MKARTLLTAALFGTLLVGLPSMSHGLSCTSVTPCAFDQLDGTGATITLGDMTFSNFTASLSGSGSFAPPAVSVINVGAGFIGGNEGLIISGPIFAGINSGVDITITYTITVSGGLIHGIELIGSPTFTGTGSAEATDTVGGVGNTALAHIFNRSAASQLSDTAILPTAVPSVDVVKHLILTGGPDGTAALTILDPNVTRVPVPAPLLLLAAGLVGVSMMGCRSDA